MPLKIPEKFYVGKNGKIGPTDFSSRKISVSRRSTGIPVEKTTSKNSQIRQICRISVPKNTTKADK